VKYIVCGHNLHSRINLKCERRARVTICDWLILEYDPFYCFYIRVGETHYISVGDDTRANNQIGSDFNGKGTLLIIDESGRNLRIYSDLYGAYPVFYCEKSFGHLLVSDNLLAFQGLRAQTDYASVHQYIKRGYCTGPYTLLSGIRRLEANSKLEISGSKIAVTHLKSFWTTGDVAESDIVEQISSCLISGAKSIPKTQLMFSAGWDSRTILAVFLAAESDFYCYSHGNINSREISIAERICLDAGVHFVKNDFSVEILSKISLEKLMCTKGSAMFPHWWNSGEYSKLNSAAITAGTFGEVLGGHYGLINSLSGYKKYLKLLSILALNRAGGKILTGKSSVEFVYDLLSDSSVFSSWVFSSNGNRALEFPDIFEESNLRLKDTLERYQNEGANSDLIYERYMTEHRGAAYINLQLMNTNANQYNIFLNPTLIKLLPKVPFKNRIHNQLNQKIVQQLNPKLLDYPMAATLVKAKRSLLSQELSRALRKLLQKSETLSRLNQNYSKYRYTDGLGWNDFRVLKEPEISDFYVQGFKTSLFSSDRMKSALLNANDHSLYSWLDMVCKSYTVDRILQH